MRFEPSALPLAQPTQRDEVGPLCFGKDVVRPRTEVRQAPERTLRTLRISRRNRLPVGEMGPSGQRSQAMTQRSLRSAYLRHLDDELQSHEVAHLVTC